MICALSLDHISHYSVTFDLLRHRKWRTASAARREARLYVLPVMRTGHYLVQLTRGERDRRQAGRTSSAAVSREFLLLPSPPPLTKKLASKLQVECPGA